MRTFAVFGSPIRHSLSPRIHHMFAEQTGLEISYTRQEPTDFERDVWDFFDEGGSGLNITLPFKRRAWQLVRQGRGTESDIVKQTSAVNTLFLEDDRKILIGGANTDGAGLVRDLEQHLQWNIKNKQLAILGAGGAAYGIIPDILNAGAAGILIVNRTHNKAEDLVAHFNSPRISCAVPEQLTKIKEDYAILINATSVSHNPENLSALASLISPHMCVYDLSYDQKKGTPFLHLARKQGVLQMADGLGMLVEQAALSFMIWNKDLTNRTPDTQLVLQKLRGEPSRQIASPLFILKLF